MGANIVLNTLKLSELLSYSAITLEIRYEIFKNKALRGTL